MIQPITAFKTQDGQLFETEELAREHEYGQVLTTRLDEFSKQKGCPYPDGVANLQMRKSIVAWELDKLRLGTVGTIDDLQLMCRTSNALKARNIFTINDLVAYTENELLKTPNLGRKSLNEVKAALRQKKLELASSS